MHRVLFLSSCCLLLVAPAMAAPTMQPGLYQANMQMSAPGMPQMPPQSHKFCITAEDMKKDPVKATMPGGDMPPECEVYDKQIRGNQSFWKMRCSGPNAMQAEGVTTFVNNGYSGVIRMTGDMMRTGKPTTMTQNISATRIGDCKKSSVPRAPSGY